MEKKFQYSFILLLFTGANIMIIYFGTLHVNGVLTKQNQKNIIRQNYMRLFDAYDTGENNIYSFFQEEDTLNILRNAYNQLKKNFQEDYYYIDNQALEFIGNYNQIMKNKKDFVEGEGEAEINQNIEGEYITPLKTLQIDYKCMEEIGVDREIKIGGFFEETTILTDEEDVLPVLVGHNYEGIFHVGSTFEAYLFGEKEITCKVVGVIRQGFDVEGKFEKIFENLIGNGDLDDYIIVPEFEYQSQNQEYKLFQKILYCQKCEGYLLVHSKKDFDNKIMILDKLNEEDIFRYDLNVVKPIYKELGIDDANLRTMLIMGILLILCSIILSVREIWKSINEKEKNGEIHMIEVVNMSINLIILVGISYGIAYYINTGIILKKYSMQVNRTAILVGIGLGIFVVSSITILIVLMKVKGSRRKK